MEETYKQTIYSKEIAMPKSTFHVDFESFTLVDRSISYNNPNNMKKRNIKYKEKLDR